MAETDRLTHRRVLKIAVPIVLSNATVPILGAVDTGVVGQMGLAVPIGAVGIGAVIISALYWIFGFLRMGTTGLTSQARGRDEPLEVSALLMRALLIGGAAGLAMVLLQLPLFWLAFKVAPASFEVESLAHDYLTIRVWSAPATIALFGITGWLIALERTGTVLVLQLWMNGLNVVLDFWFVLGLGWGVGGVAFATFLAEWSALALGIWFCRDAFTSTHWPEWSRIFDRARLVHMASVNGDILIRSVILQAIFVSFLFYGSGLGDVELAANQILVQFLQITAFGLDGFAFAAEALVGSAFGAGSVARLRRGALLTSGWGAFMCLSLSAVFLIFGTTIIDIMTTAPEVRAAARVYLVYMALAPILGVAAWMFDGIFIGATRSRDMRNMMVISAAIYFAAVAVLLPTLGNQGLWIALLISLVVRGVTLGARYPALERAVQART